MWRTFAASTTASGFGTECVVKYPRIILTWCRLCKHSFLDCFSISEFFNLSASTCSRVCWTAAAVMVENRSISSWSVRNSEIEQPLDLYFECTWVLFFCFLQILHDLWAGQVHWHRPSSLCLLHGLFCHCARALGTTKFGQRCVATVNHNCPQLRVLFVRQSHLRFLLRIHLAACELPFGGWASWRTRCSHGLEMESEESGGFRPDRRVTTDWVSMRSGETGRALDDRWDSLDVETNILRLSSWTISPTSFPYHGLFPSLRTRLEPLLLNAYVSNARRILSFLCSPLSSSDFVRTTSETSSLARNRASVLRSN